MKSIFFLFLILLALAAPASAADYEVIIEGQTYLFSQGAEKQITLRDGKRISVSVKAVKTKDFQGHGISFSYPSEMKLSQESFYGIKQITIESTDSTLLMIQVFPSGTTPAEVQRDLLASFRDEFSKLGARFPAKSTAPCKRDIGGAERQGVHLLFTLGSLAHKSEIYTLQKGGKTIALVFQYAEEDKDKATPRYDVIANSFK